MTDTLIVVKNNQYGLTRDAKLLAAALAEAGVDAAIAGIGERSLRDRMSGTRRARRIVHIERVFPHWLGAGETNVLVPLDYIDEESGTPSYKSVPVRVRRSPSA